MRQLRISFTGAGKVASALCSEFISKGHIIQQIVSPGIENGPVLANDCGARWSGTPQFDDSNDLIIIAVPDHVLIEVLDSIKCGDGTVVVHTAGSYGLEVFPESIRKRGVFYPLQTFTRGRKLDFTEIPIFTEYAEPETGEMLRSLAESVGSSIYLADSSKRRLLHIAAVFISNFPNHLLTLGADITDRTGFPFVIFKPLLCETVRKAIEQGPVNSQTGPAVRYDANTIKKHLELLSFYPDMKRIYEEMTRSITDYYKKRQDE